MQADFILFIRAELKGEDYFPRWWPETLLYLGHFHSPFEVFARARSKQYFDKIKCLFDIDTPDDLKQLLQQYREQKRELPSWEFNSLSLASLLNIENLATRP